MNYFKEYFDLISLKMQEVDLKTLDLAANLILRTGRQGGKVILAGNGGSCAIASHISVDLTNSSKIRAITFNESNLITCFANDYGYERWLEKALEYYADNEDTIILISSSGQSANIINAARKAKEMNLGIITLSGFEANNPLRKMGDVNLWVKSEIYNVIETIHNTWLSSIVDKIRNDTLKVYSKGEGAIPVVDIVVDRAKNEDEISVL